jgi:hypothetical protein
VRAVSSICCGQRHYFCCMFNAVKRAAAKITGRLFAQTHKFHILSFAVVCEINIERGCA